MAQETYRYSVWGRGGEGGGSSASRYFSSGPLTGGHTTRPRNGNARAAVRGINKSTEKFVKAHYFLFLSCHPSAMPRCTPPVPTPGASAFAKSCGDALLSPRESRILPSVTSDHASGLDTSECALGKHGPCGGHSSKRIRVHREKVWKIVLLKPWPLLANPAGRLTSAEDLSSWRHSSPRTPRA